MSNAFMWFTIQKVSSECSGINLSPSHQQCYSFPEQLYKVSMCIQAGKQTLLQQPTTSTPFCLGDTGTANLHCRSLHRDSPHSSRELSSTSLGNLSSTRRLGCFQTFSVTNNAAMSGSVHRSFFSYLRVDVITS